MKLRILVLLVVLAVVVGAGVAFWRGSGPLPDPERCTATAAGRTVVLSTEQAENASLIAAIGVRRGLPARAVSIALATAYQESKLRNISHGDRDSLGLFQQRPSQGWGTAAQVQDPYHSINAFYDALAKIRGYKRMRITEAAQRVQRSGFPEAYEAHAPDARTLASVLTGYSPGALLSCVVNRTGDRQTGAEVVRLVRKAYGDVDAARTGARQDVVVRVSDAPAGLRQGWSVAQFVVAHGARLRPEKVTYAGRTWTIDRASEAGWTRAGTNDATEVRVSMG